MIQIELTGPFKNFPSPFEGCPLIEPTGQKRICYSIGDLKKEHPIIGNAFPLPVFDNNHPNRFCTWLELHPYFDVPKQPLENLFIKYGVAK